MFAKVLNNKHEFTNVNIPNNLTLSNPAVQNNDGVSGSSLVASTVFPLWRRPELSDWNFSKVFSLFSSRYTRTLYRSCISRAPSSIMVLHCSGAIAVMNVVLLLSTPHLPVSGGLWRGTPSALECGCPWSGPLHLRPTLLQLRLGGSVLTPIQTRCPRQWYVCALLSSLPTMHACELRSFVCACIVLMACVSVTYIQCT